MLFCLFWWQWHGCEISYLNVYKFHIILQSLCIQYCMYCLPRMVDWLVWNANDLDANLRWWLLMFNLQCCHLHMNDDKWLFVFASRLNLIYEVIFKVKCECRFCEPCVQKLWCCVWLHEVRACIIWCSCFSKEFITI